MMKGMNTKTQENEDFEKLEKKLITTLSWYGEDDKLASMHDIQFSFCFGEKTIHIHRTIIMQKWLIEFIVDEKILFKDLYDCLCTFLRFEYLIEGRFIKSQLVKADDEDISVIVFNHDLKYFNPNNYRHVFELQLLSTEYGSFFEKWIILEKDIGIINQMILYADNSRDIPADVRFALTVEAFEGFAKFLELKGYITVEEATNNFNVSCPSCGMKFKHEINTGKSFANCLKAIFDTFGKPVFITEYGSKDKLISRTIKTRNKMLHVNNGIDKVLEGRYAGFYTIKYAMLYRYIIWIILGIDKEYLNCAVEKSVKEFENKFPNCIFKE